MMNYAEIIDKLEKLKTGDFKVSGKQLLSAYEEFTGRKVMTKILYVPNSYEGDSIGIFCEAILKEHQYIVGRFTSYAIKQICGHILYQKRNISQKDFAKVFENLYQNTSLDNLQFSRLSICFMVAIEYFQNNRCDYIILPEEIEIDMQDTFEHSQKRTLLGQSVLSEYGELKFFTPSRKEVRNCSISLQMLLNEEICLQDKKVQNAIQKVKLEGRFEVVRQKPYIILDGADSKESVRCLMANMQYYFPNNPYIFILGTLQKNYEEIVKESVCKAQYVLTVTPADTSNALPGLELAKEVKKLNQNIINAGSMEEAIEMAMLLSRKDTVIAVFGTTVLLAKSKAVISKQISSS